MLGIVNHVYVVLIRPVVDYVHQELCWFKL